MKRTFALLLAVIILLASFSACGNGKASKPSRGIWNEDKTEYENTFAELKVKLPEGWKAFEDDEISALIGSGMDIMGVPGGEFTQEMLEMKTIMDFIIQNPTTAETVFMGIENLALTPGATKMSTEELFEQVVDISSMMGGDINFEFGEFYKSDAFGQEYETMDATAEMMGMQMEQRYYIRRIGDYMIMIMINTTPLGMGMDNLVDVL